MGARRLLGMLGLMSEYDDRIGVIAERTSVAMHAFWSAMLTAHTVLLSVAVALPAAIPSAYLWQFKVVGATATACILALLFNFAAVRMQYEEIGRSLLDYEAELTVAQRKSGITSAVRRHYLVRVAEVIAATGLIIEACLLVWVLIR